MINQLLYVDENLGFDPRDKGTNCYIFDEIHRLNYRRLRLLIFVPLFLSLLILYTVAAEVDLSTRFLGTVPLNTSLIRAAFYALLVILLFFGRGEKKIILHISFAVLIVLIASLTASTLNIAVLMKLLVNVFLLNLFLFLPPKISISTNSLILVSFLYFRILHASPQGEFVAQSGLSMFLPVTISFIILMVMVTYLSYYNYRDIIRQIYLRKLSSDQIETIKAQKEELEELNKMRDHVERVVRHDLKSPLNGVIGASQILMEEDICKERKEFVSLIQQSGHKMLHMVDNSLDLYHMEEGNYLVKAETFNIRELLDELQRESSSQLMMKNLSMSISFIPKDADENAAMEGERIKIASMLSNLITNAIEASPAGETVDITVNVENPGKVIMDIHNPGAIPEDIRSNFFTKYSTSGKKNGTGLGTHSAMLIARSHGGDISFTTSEEEGTHLHIVLPRQQGV
ncbi:MAG: sensor histidine kinase [Spirochaetaceae bacterium]